MFSSREYMLVHYPGHASHLKDLGIHLLSFLISFLCENVHLVWSFLLRILIELDNFLGSGLVLQIISIKSGKKTKRGISGKYLTQRLFLLFSCESSHTTVPSLTSVPQAQWPLASHTIPTLQSFLPRTRGPSPRRGLSAMPSLTSQQLMETGWVE